jgi:hypothetical protein
VRPAIWLVPLLALSCRESPETRPDPATSARGEPPAVAPAPPAPADASPVAAAAPPAVDPDAPCASDGDCAFNNPCDPQRCVAAASVPHSPGCKESREPTGTCVCFEKHCSLKPGPNHPKVSVEADCDYVPGCALDRASGTCAPGKDDDFRPNREIGPRCDCDSHVPRRCQFAWLDPIACTSVEDCWVDPAPFSHPIRRPRSKKGKKFRPCKDGEVAPACMDGHCTTRAYGC